MAIFKAVTHSDGSSIGRATPDRLENYLKYQTDEKGKIIYDENGEPIKRTEFVTAINGDAYNFSADCRFLAAIHDTCYEYDSLKYKHYIQGFAPEDSKLMTKEECHALGVEMAKAAWKDFPVLVVTHYEQTTQDGEYHWHNHFIVYNCRVTDGKKLDTSRGAMWAQKGFVALQSRAHGLTQRGLVFDEHGCLKSSQLGKKVDLTERKTQKTGQKKLDAENAVKPKEQIVQRKFLTQKEELRRAVQTAMSKTESYSEMRKYLKRNYGIETEEKRGDIKYIHPERAGEKNPYIRGRTLGENYTKEGIENAYKQRKRSTDLGGRRNYTEHIGSAGTDRAYRAAGGSEARYTGTASASDARRADKDVEGLRRLYEGIVRSTKADDSQYSRDNETFGDDLREERRSIGNSSESDIRENSGNDFLKRDDIRESDGVKNGDSGVSEDGKQEQRGRHGKSL